MNVVEIEPGFGPGPKDPPRNPAETAFYAHLALCRHCLEDQLTLCEAGVSLFHAAFQDTRDG